MFARDDNRIKYCIIFSEPFTQSFTFYRIRRFFFQFVILGRCYITLHSLVGTYVNAGILKMERMRVDVILSSSEVVGLSRTFIARLQARDQKCDLRYFELFCRCRYRFWLNLGRWSRTWDPFVAKTTRNYSEKRRVWANLIAKTRFSDQNTSNWWILTQEFDKFEFLDNSSFAYYFLNNSNWILNKEVWIKFHYIRDADHE